jgi:hypothetical protein
MSVDRELSNVTIQQKSSQVRKRIRWYPTEAIFYRRCAWADRLANSRLNETALPVQVSLDKHMRPAVQDKLIADLPPSDSFEKIEVFFLDVSVKNGSAERFDLRYGSLHELATGPAAITLQYREPAAPPCATVVMVDAHRPDNPAA